MSRPRKLDALTPAERARRYRQRRAGCVARTVAETIVTETAVTETIVTETAVTETIVTETAVTGTRCVAQSFSEDEWPFPGTERWFRRYGFVRAHPVGSLA